MNSLLLSVTVTNVQFYKAFKFLCMNTMKSIEKTTGDFTLYKIYFWGFFM